MNFVVKVAERHTERESERERERIKRLANGAGPFGALIPGAATPAENEKKVKREREREEEVLVPCPVIEKMVR